MYIYIYIPGYPFSPWLYGPNGQPVGATLIGKVTLVSSLDGMWVRTGFFCLWNITVFENVVSSPIELKFIELNL